MMTSSCIGLIVVVYEMSLRGHSERDGIGLMNFWVYVCFAIVFAVSQHISISDSLLVKRPSKTASSRQTIDLKR
jgi:hypothetical protein